jgi:hypothetical protein
LRRLIATEPCAPPTARCQHRRALANVRSARFSQFAFLVRAATPQPRMHRGMQTRAVSPPLAASTDPVWPTTASRESRRARGGERITPADHEMRWHDPDDVAGERSPHETVQVSSRVKPSQVKSNQAKSSQAKPSQVKPSQVKPSQVKSSQAESSQATSSQGLGSRLDGRAQNRERAAELAVPQLVGVHEARRVLQMRVCASAVPKQTLLCYVRSC